MSKLEHHPSLPERKNLIEQGLRLLGAWEQWLLVGLLLAMVGMIATLLWPKPQAVITLKPYSYPSANIAETAVPAIDSINSESAAVSDHESQAPVSKKRRHSRSHSHNKKPKHPPVMNLNQASSSQLQLLPGIGPKMAVRILEYRKANGGFKSLEQIMDVKGIGLKKYEKIKPYLRI